MTAVWVIYISLSFRWDVCVWHIIEPKTIFHSVCNDQTQLMAWTWKLLLRRLFKPHSQGRTHVSSPYTNVHTRSLSTAQPWRKLMCYRCQPEYLECAVSCRCVMHCCEGRGDEFQLWGLCAQLSLKQIWDF